MQHCWLWHLCNIVSRGSNATKVAATSMRQQRLWLQCNTIELMLLLNKNVVTPMQCYRPRQTAMISTERQQARLQCNNNKATASTNENSRGSNTTSPSIVPMQQQQPYYNKVKDNNQLKNVNNNNKMRNRSPWIVRDIIVDIPYRYRAGHHRQHIVHRSYKTLLATDHTQHTQPPTTKRGKQQ